MEYGYNVYKTDVEGHVFWVAESKDLKGCVGQGETLEDAISELETNEKEWLEAAKEYGIAIPQITIEKAEQYSGKFVTRISPLIHKEAAENASKQGISLNQYVNNAIVVANTSNTTCEAVKGVIDELKAMTFSSATKLMKNENHKFVYEAKNAYAPKIELSRSNVTIIGSM